MQKYHDNRQKQIQLKGKGMNNVGEAGEEGEGEEANDNQQNNKDDQNNGIRAQDSKKGGFFACCGPREDAQDSETDSEEDKKSEDEGDEGNADKNVENYNLDVFLQECYSQAQ